MDGPIRAPLAILASTVEWVHDPNTLGGEPRRLVLLLLGQNGVVRPLRSQCLHDERIGDAVTRLAELLTLEESAALQTEQQFSGCLSYLLSERLIVHGITRWMM
jgi:hypothetical protein